MSVGTTSDLLYWEHVSQTQIERTWVQIDHKLSSLKAAEISEEIRLAIKAEANRISSQQRSNDNWMAVRQMQVAAEVRFTNEWVEKLYTAYCDVWTKQGETKTAVFIRCVFHKAIEPLIEMRKHNALNWITQELRRTGGRMDIWNAVKSSFEAELTRLDRRWRRKLQIEARECQHALRQNHIAGDESARQGHTLINTRTAYAGGPDLPVLRDGPKAKSRSPRQPALTKEEEEALKRKLGNPPVYPALSVREVAAAVGKSESTIYRWVETGKLKSSNVPGRVLTKSVKSLLKGRKDK